MHTVRVVDKEVTMGTDADLESIRSSVSASMKDLIHLIDQLFFVTRTQYTGSPFSPIKGVAVAVDVDDALPGI